MSLAQTIILAHVAYRAAGSTEEIIATERVPASEVWHIDRYTFRLRTDELTIVTSFVDRAGDRILLEQWPAPANPFLYVDKGPFRMGDGDRLALAMTGCGANDDIDLYVFGHVIEAPYIERS